MKISEKLNGYISRLSCTGRDICVISGISPSTLTRNRSGDREPELGSAAFDGLCDAIAGIASDRGDADITAASVKEEFIACVEFVPTDRAHLRHHPRHDT